MHKKIANLFLFFLLAIPYCLQASPSCSKWVATAVSIKGKVDTQYSDNSNWNPIIMGHHFCYGDKVRTSKHSRIALIFKGGPRITLNQNSTLSFSSTTEKKTSWIINLIRGSSFIRSRQSHRLNVQTPFINAVHEGTEFLVTVNDKQTEITVFDGQVAGTNPMGEIHIKKGYTGVAVNKQVPYVRPILIRPEDAVQWSLYYPPIIDSNAFTQAIFQPSLKAYKQGNPTLALNLLEKVGQLEQDINYLSLKSSLLLVLGSVSEALKNIDQALLIAPNNSSSYALQSIIAVTKNRQDKALELAKKAVTLDPKSATAQIALSYAYQAKFKIPKSLIATKVAVDLSPNNALAWARLAELQLSTGNHNAALSSAKKAQSLNPSLGRTQTVLGFNYLAQIDIDEAKTAFTQAIKLNSADPLAHLGLGLAKIRKGAVKEGSSDIETAASLDPDNAMMRSYLGKAYYELRNDEYAATELNIAKQIDPNDPTPWFYDAIRKQTTNRPVEALHDMQKTIELNDNRGVYRSKLLLDEDLAARSASLGRIYNDLDFQQLGLVEGWKSTTRNPNNHSAHRLLADNYKALPRHEIARVSELLQSQLLQPLNMTPVQPQLAESDLLLQDSLGPGTTSFNEFNPLFSKNRFNLQTSAIFGGNDTWGDEIVQSGLWDQFSYSLGHFHYETNGFRDNNRLETTIYNIFAQVALPYDTNIQFEYRNNQTETGDLTLKFDRNDFSKNLTKNIDTQTARLGFHFKFDSRTDFIGSTIYSEKKTQEQDSSRSEDFDGFFTSTTNRSSNTSLDTQAFSIELQGLHQFDQSSFILGLGYYSQNESLIINSNTISDISAIFPIPGFPLHIEDPTLTTIDRDAKHYNAYLYSNFFIKNNFIATLGLSIDSLDSNSLGKLEKISPKIGAKWIITPHTTFRAAYLETIKRPHAANQTIEPTHIAGFNQFYDDLNGADTTLYGFAVDLKISPKIHLGGELKWRNIKTPVRNTSKKGQHEQLHRSYIYWTPLDNIALNFEYNYERIKRDLLTNSDLLATKLVTHKVPLGFNYFLANGFFTNISATYYAQKIEKIDNRLQGKSTFWILDTEIGYRLPNRWGIFKFGIQNALNNKSHYEQFNFPTGTDSKPSLLFSPERIFFTNFTISFN